VLRKKKYIYVRKLDVDVQACVLKKLACISLQIYVQTVHTKKDEKSLQLPKYKYSVIFLFLMFKEVCLIFILLIF